MIEVRAEDALPTIGAVDEGVVHLAGLIERGELQRCALCGVSLLDYRPAGEEGREVELRSESGIRRFWTVGRGVFVEDGACYSTTVPPTCGGRGIEELERRGEDAGRRA